MSGDPCVPNTVAPGALTALLQELVHGKRADQAASWVGELRPGAVIGTYELVRQIGRGGFSIVYEATDRNTGRAVAFKAVRAAGPLAVRDERVLREAELAARLSHPNIVALHDVGRCEHGAYLVLELLEGETLARRLRRGKLSIGEALRIASEVARAIAYAHDAGVVHRDITPGNVFLCSDRRVKVLDLGMAQAFGRRKIDGGTPSYMAPEQRRGAPEDERTDVFALGVVLHEMLTGRAVLERRAGVPALQIAGAPGLPELLDGMLAVDPILRPRDAGDVVAALAAIIGDLRCDRDAPAAVSRPPTPVRASVAVLPFTDERSTPEDQYLGEGLAAAILSGLAQVPQLSVIGRASSLSFRDGEADPVAVARALDVSALLEGRFRRSGTQLSVAARLASTVDGATIWSGRYDRELGAVFAVEEEIARAVAVALGAPPHGSAAPGRPQPTNIEAYGAYLRGQHSFVRGLHANALEHFEAALRSDPHYAPALASIALAAMFVQEFDRDVDAARERPREAIAAAERAVGEAPELAEARAARGLVRAAFVHDWEGALADVDRAVELRRDGETLRARGIVRIALGRIDDAIGDFHDATRTDPVSPAAWNTVGAALLAKGDFAPAESALRRAIGVSPAQAYAPGNLGMVLLLQGRATDALHAWQRSTSEIVRLMGSAIVQRTLGNLGEAERAVEAMTSRFGDQGAFRIAQVHAHWGNVTRAIDWLEHARRCRSARLAMEIKSHPFLRPLRSRPGYRAILEKLDLPVDP